MAGHVPKRILKQPEVDKLLNGCVLWRWEDVRYINILHIRASVVLYNSTCVHTACYGTCSACTSVQYM